VKVRKNSGRQKAPWRNSTANLFKLIMNRYEFRIIWAQ